MQASIDTTAVDRGTNRGQQNRDRALLHFLCCGFLVFLYQYFRSSYYSYLSRTGREGPG